MINQGDKPIVDIKLGDVDITKVYLGDGLVWERNSGEYRFVNYYEADGTVHFSTNCVPQSGKLKTVWDLEITSTVNMNISGNYSTRGSGSYHWLWWGTERGFGTWQYNPQVSEFYPAPTMYKDLNTRYTVIAEYKSGYRSLSINGDLYTTNDGVEVGTRPVWLFSNSPSEGHDKAHLKLYSLKIYDDTTLIGDFVPAVRNADNVHGLYNRVNNDFVY